MWGQRCHNSGRQYPKIYRQNRCRIYILVTARSPRDMSARWRRIATNKSVLNSEKMDLPPLWRVLPAGWSRKVWRAVSIFPVWSWNNKCCPVSARFPQLHCYSTLRSPYRSYSSRLGLYWHCKDECGYMVDVRRKWGGKIPLRKQKGREEDETNERA